jgi:hypothetical protein
VLNLGDFYFVHSPVPVGVFWFAAGYHATGYERNMCKMMYITGFDFTPCLVVLDWGLVCWGITRVILFWQD